MTGPDVDWASPSLLDREPARRRDPAWLRSCWAHPGSVVLGVGPDGRLAADAAGRPLLEAARDVSADPSGDNPSDDVVLVGRLLGSERWVWARGVDETPSPAVGLRDLPAGVEPAVAEAAVVAVALVRWHRDARHAPLSGLVLRSARAGVVRVPLDATVGDAVLAEEFPRTDPAVIMAVVDAEDRLLLARQPTWPPRRMSVLAGFVEAGESLEQAVHREVAEEAGVRLGAVAYVGSQPWPQPRSLMVGFVARATSTELELADDELEWAGWFTREEAARQRRTGELLLPGSTSLGHHLITQWLAGALPPV